MKKITGSFETTLSDVSKYDIYSCCDVTSYTKYETKNYVTNIYYELLFDDKDNNRIIRISSFFNTLKGDTYCFNDDIYFCNVNFEKLYLLIYNKFGSETEVFGTITETYTGNTYSIIKKRSLENIINVLVYALQDLFVCVRQIVEYYKEHTLNYCYTQDYTDNNTYEKYLHIITCQLIVSSDYYKDTIPSQFHQKDKIDFINSSREFSLYLLEIL